MVALSIWYLLKDNINANQIFSSIFSPFYAIMIALSLVLLVMEKKVAIAILGFFIYVMPGFISYYNDDFTALTNEDKEIANAIPAGVKVLYLPSQDEVNTIYKYHERFYIPINRSFMFKEHFHVINVAAALPRTFDIKNSIGENTFAFYRSISPFYNFCGEIKEDSLLCVNEFMENYSINYLLVNKENDSFSNMNIIWVGDHLKLLKLPLSSGT